VRGKYYFSFIYDGGEAGVDIYDLPPRSFQIRHSVNSDNDHVIYVSAVFGADALSVIAAAADYIEYGDAYIAIKYGEIYIIGDSNTYDSIELTDIRYDEGAVNFSISITARSIKSFPVFSSSTYETEAKLTYRNISNGDITLRFSAIDWGIIPKDNVGFYEGDYITVDKINITADATSESMQLSGIIYSGGGGGE